MTMEASNVAILRSAYKAWADCNGKDPGCWLEILADNVSFSSLGEGKGRPAYFNAKNGRERLLDYFQGVAGDWIMVQSVVSEFVAQGDTVVMRGFCAWTYRKTGRTVISPKIDFWRLKDGKAVEYFQMFDTAAMMDAMR